MRKRSEGLRAAVCLAGLASCGSSSATVGVDYLSMAGTVYRWLGGTFRGGDIEAVEAALVARGWCSSPLPWAQVAVVAEPFECPVGRCAGRQEVGSPTIKVAGEPWRCAGQSALHHEWVHLCTGLADPLPAGADEPVPCEVAP